MVSSKVSLICGTVSVLLGGFVLFAWITNNISLIQIRPSLVPMSFLTALGFAISGIGLVLLNRLSLEKARTLGIALLALSGLSFTTFLSPGAIVSTYFLLPEDLPWNSVSPSTALCFLLAGVAFLVVTDSRLLNKGTLIAGMLGALIFSLGSVGLFMNLMELNQQDGWSEWVRMAVHVPGGFGVLAIGLIAFSWRNEQRKVIGSPEWMPVLVGLGGIIMTVGLWIHTDGEDQAFLPTGVLVFGLLMALSLAMTVYFLQRERGLLEQLHHSHHGLEREIAERKQAEERLRNSRGELRNLNHRLQSIREEEKSKIAREVHDELGQVLTALKMDLSCLEEEVALDPKVFGEKILSMENLLDQTVETVQRICLELRPKILDVFGLSDAIEWQTKEFQRNTGISCELAIEQRDLSLDSERSITCFRVLQEALTNVARHAKATHVHIRIAKDEGNVQLEVIDNGEGIEEHQVFHSHSLGLIGIRERVHHVEGEVSITGKPGQGTRVSVNIPCQHP